MHPKYWWTWKGTTGERCPTSSCCFTTWPCPAWGWCSSSGWPISSRSWAPRRTLSFSHCRCLWASWLALSSSCRWSMFARTISPLWACCCWSSICRLWFRPYSWARATTAHSSTCSSSFSSTSFRICPSRFLPRRTSSRKWRTPTKSISSSCGLAGNS